MDRIINTVLLTGATGYLGKKLLKRLIEDNYKVIVIKRVDSKIESLLKISDTIAFYNNDVESIKNAFAEHNVDIVIHTATAYGRKSETSNQIKETNLDFPLNILLEAIKTGTKYFINTGTSLPFLTNQYSLFKNQFSECLEFFSDKITPINILLEHFYGPEDDNSKFITGMISKMKTNVENIELTEGTQIRDFIYIDDVVNAYFVLLNQIESFKGYQTIPLGSGNGIKVRSIVEMIKNISNSTSNLVFGAIEMRPNELLKSDADIAKLKSLGWYPSFTLEEGLKLTIESYKN